MHLSQGAPGFTPIAFGTAVPHSERPIPAIVQAKQVKGIARQIQVAALRNRPSAKPFVEPMVAQTINFKVSSCRPQSICQGSALVTGR